MSLLYVALGGGHGHALRAFSVVRRLAPGAQAVIPARLAPWARQAGVAFRSPPETGARAWFASLPAPALLLVDVFPLGPFGELAGLLGRGPAWLVGRRAKAELYLEPRAREAVESLYESIVWTEEPHPEWTGLRVGQRRLEPVLLDAAPLSREAAREDLGLAGPRVAAAGPRVAAAGLRAGAAGPLPVVLAIGAGSRDRQAALRRLLLKACSRLGARLAFLTDELPEGGGVHRRFPAARWLAAADAVVVSGGYHSAHEARRAGARAVFLPQPRPVDDQRWRVRGLPTARDPWELERVLRGLLQERRASPPAGGFSGAEQLAALVERRVKEGVLPQEKVAAPALVEAAAPREGAPEPAEGLA